MYDADNRLGTQIKNIDTIWKTPNSPTSVKTASRLLSTPESTPILSVDGIQITGWFQNITTKYRFTFHFFNVRPNNRLSIRTNQNQLTTHFYFYLLFDRTYFRMYVDARLRRANEIKTETSSMTTSQITHSHWCTLGLNIYIVGAVVNNVWPLFNRCFELN